ncbi:MAG: hypothetical protein FWF24_02930 [Alphaproteobacteria bacterium]|nr:hypothetical protein [Alphaproteobacteria bacterium]
MALRLHASRINDTWIARNLSKEKRANYFQPVYEKLIKHPDDSAKLDEVLQAAYNTVWGGVSIEFAKLPFKEIATAVCGAAKKQVFFRYELPVLVQNPHIQACNEIPMDAVRRMYNEVGKDEAYNLICLSELRMAFRYASGFVPSPHLAWKDFVDRIYFHRDERFHTAPKRSPLTTEQEQRKQQIIADFGLDTLYATSPVAWGGPVAVTKKSKALPYKKITL